MNRNIIIALQQGHQKPEQSANDSACATARKCKTVLGMHTSTYARMHTQSAFHRLLRIAQAYTLFQAGSLPCPCRIKRSLQTPKQPSSPFLIPTKETKRLPFLSRSHVRPQLLTLRTIRSTCELQRRHLYQAIPQVHHVAQKRQFLVEDNGSAPTMHM